MICTNVKKCRPLIVLFENHIAPLKKYSNLEELTLLERNAFNNHDNNLIRDQKNIIIVI